MAHFAKLDLNNTVLEVVVVVNSVLLDENNVEREELGLAFLIQWSNGYPYWKQTSYTGRFRKNFAGIGSVYDPVKDAFIPPKPYASWTLDTESYKWKPPVELPGTDRLYVWNEQSLSWTE
jgi:hypothetical protein